MTDANRVATWCGVAAPAVALGAVLLATVVAPPETFTWQDRALSDMGRPGTTTFWLFNGGLVAGGLLGVPFLVPLRSAARNAVERAGVTLFAVPVLGLALTGFLHLPKESHGLAAMLVFVGAPFAQWTHGVGAVLADDGRWGLVSVGFGTTHVVAWVGWLAFVARSGTDDWFAVPELVAALAFACWTAALAHRLLGREHRVIDEDRTSEPRAD